MDVFAFIQKNKNSVLSAGLILLSLFISLRIYQGQEVDIANLKKRAQNEARSNEIFRNLTILDEKVNTYKRSLKIKNTAEVMSLVSELTKKAGIKLDSIRPLNETVGEDYVKFSVTAVMRLNNYNQMGEFLSRIENDSTLFVIDSLKINREDQNLILNVRISAIRVA